MNAHDWIWIGALALSAFNAWQNERIKGAILQLKNELSERIGTTATGLSDRIAKNESDVAVLKATGNRIYR
jgi:hypothetical protein